MIVTRFAPAHVLVVCAIALTSILIGCARQEPDRIAAEPAPPSVHSIFVVAHRYHAGLAVRAQDVARDAWPARSDLPDADYLELGWGEREYYPHDDPGIGMALRALFTPSRSTIRVISIGGSLTRALPDSEIVELRVSRDDFARMVEFVRESHEFDAGGRAIVISAGVHQQGRFYASPRTFHALENCNVWVARALQGCGAGGAPGNRDQRRHFASPGAAFECRCARGDPVAAPRPMSSVPHPRRFG